MISAVRLGWRFGQRNYRTVQEIGVDGVGK